jgi:tetratricopeptide (TPR) repeat protein
MLRSDDADSTSAMTGARTEAPAASANRVYKAGSLLSDRYEIISLLGEGGMGAVYKAFDRELDRTVAMKVIRTQFASEPSALKRFKQELVLARQVTHRNVIRIFDLGVSDGFRFITMEYVEGANLSSILRERGKLSPHEAISLIRQVSQGLQVAHNEGVIHRDLKPANIMIDSQGRAIVMDFGIARSNDGGTISRTGDVVGTPAYMSPEQAKGNALDARSDIYSLGVILYEMLAGVIPFQDENAMSMLLKRCQQDPVPPAEVEPSIPPQLSRIVTKALAREASKRYQNVQDLLNDLDRFEAPEPPPRRKRMEIAAFLMVTLLCVGLGGLGVLWFRASKAPKAPKAVTVLVADFDNTTSENVFDGTLEPVFIAGLEGAPFVSVYNRGAAYALARELKPGAAKINEVVARLIAKREGINVVLTGLVARQDDGYRVSVNAIDGATGKTIMTRDSPQSRRDDVLQEASKLVPRLRRALGDVSPESQLAASGETFTSSSLDAVHDYGVAQQLQWEGKYEQAEKLYLAAAKADSQFGRAYAGLAMVNTNLGRPEAAIQYYELAFRQLGRMTERERLRTRGTYFLVVRDDQKAIAESTTLIRQFPFDTAGHANLALAFCYSRDMIDAVTEGRKAIELYPKNTIHRNNLAFYNLYRGDTAEATRQGGIVISENPAYAKAYLVTAEAQLLDGKIGEAVKTFQRLQHVESTGPSYAAVGLADLAMYQGRFSDAGDLLAKASASDSTEPSKLARTSKILLQAESYLAQGKPALAVPLAQNAASLSNSDVVQVIAARVLGEAHHEDRAQQIAAELGKRVSVEAGAWSKVINAELLIADGELPKAIEMLSNALKLTDVWLAHFDLARAYVAAGAYAQASSELDLCLKRRGEASSVFIEDYFPTIRYLPPVYYYAGRAQEALGTSRAAESYKTFLAIKEKSQGDPLVEDARRRLDALATK